MTACGQILVSVGGCLLLAEDRFFTVEGRLFAVESRFLPGRSPVASAWLSSAASSASFAGLLSYFFSFFFCSLRSSSDQVERLSVIESDRDFSRLFIPFRAPN